MHINDILMGLSIKILMKIHDILMGPCKRTTQSNSMAFLGQTQ